LATQSRDIEKTWPRWLLEPVFPPVFQFLSKMEMENCTKCNLCSWSRNWEREKHTFSLGYPLIQILNHWCDIYV